MSKASELGLPGSVIRRPALALALKVPQCEHSPGQGGCGQACGDSQSRHSGDRLAPDIFEVCIIFVGSFNQSGRIGLTLKALTLMTGAF